MFIVQIHLSYKLRQTAADSDVVTADSLYRNLTFNCVPIFSAPDFAFLDKKIFGQTFFRQLKLHLSPPHLPWHDAGEYNYICNTVGASWVAWRLFIEMLTC